MKDQVIEFLGNPPKSKPEQFNQALSLYKDSRNHNPSQVRYMNTLGFSADRLESLLYDLKKLHNIRDVEVANARNSRKSEDGSPKENEVALIDAADVDVVTQEFHAEGAEEDAVDAEVLAADAAEVAAIAASNTESAEESAGEQETENGKPQTDAAIDPSLEFLKSLAAFDVEAAKYQHLKAFAAVVSDVIGEEAENQKGDTLKAFVLAAKKKYQA